MGPILEAYSHLGMLGQARRQAPEDVGTVGAKMGMLSRGRFERT